MDENQDVTQVEQTTEASSAENQTTETNQEETQDDSKSKTVPYDRFQEVIKDRKELESELEQVKAQIAALSKPQTQADPKRETVKSELKSYLEELAPELGFVSKKELEEREADKQLQNEVSNLKSKYDGKDGRPKYDHVKVLQFAKDHYIGDLEIAYKQMNEAQLLNWAIAQATGKKPVKTEASDGSGGSVGTNKGDLLKAASSGDQDAIKALIRQAI